jgi:protein SCO1
MVWSKSIVVRFMLSLMLGISIASAATAGVPAALQGIGFDQRLNEQVPLELVFTNESGKPIQLGECFGSKPVILVLAYYQCPRLCTLVLNGLVQGMLEMRLTAGREYNVVVVSFDPREDWQLAASKKESYLLRYGRPGAEAGWHFLTGESESIEPLAEAVGFRYRFDPAQNQFVHASGIMILTPGGKISRYFYDVNYSGRDLRLGLVEASNNKIGSPIDQILLYCLHYDATLGKYSASIMNIVRFAGATTMLAIGAFVLLLRRKTAAKSGLESPSAKVEEHALCQNSGTSAATSDPNLRPPGASV